MKTQIKVSYRGLTAKLLAEQEHAKLTDVVSQSVADAVAIIEKFYPDRPPTKCIILVQLGNES